MALLFQRSFKKVIIIAVLVLGCCVFDLFGLLPQGDVGEEKDLPPNSMPNRNPNEREPITIVPSSSTYICAFMRNATPVPSGCVETCVAEGRDGPVSFLCHVRRRRPQSAEEFMKGDIVMNHYNEPIPRRGPNGPPYLTLYYSGESNGTVKKFRRYRPREFDMVVSFHHHRPLYFTWTSEHQVDFMQILNTNIQGRGPTSDAIWIEWQARLPAVAVFVSNCNPMRKKILQLLSGVYEVHSFGGCRHNKGVRQECKNLKQSDQKICVFRKYKYSLSMENTKERDYVTEKVYHVLLGGAIPLYWGAPNIEEFVPGGRRSFIDMNKFLPTQLGGYMNESTEGNASHLIRMLSDHLRRLETDKAAVMNLMGWRLARRTEEWGKEFWNNLFHTHPICGVCVEAYKRRSQRSPTKNMKT